MGSRRDRVEQRPQRAGRRVVRSARRGRCTTRGSRAATGTGWSRPSVRSRRSIDVVATRVAAVLMSAEAEHLVEAGDDGELFGFDAVDADPVEQLDDVALHVAPHLLRAARWRRAACRRGRRRSRVGSEPRSASNASASECAGSVDSTSVRRPRSAHASAVAADTVVLPTPPLPVKSRMRLDRHAAPTDSTRSRNWRSAVLTMRAAARCLMKPGQRELEIDFEVVRDLACPRRTASNSYWPSTRAVMSPESCTHDSYVRRARSSRRRACTWSSDRTRRRGSGPSCARAVAVGVDHGDFFEVGRPRRIVREVGDDREDALRWSRYHDALRRLITHFVASEPRLVLVSRRRSVPTAPCCCAASPRSSDSREECRSRRRSAQ